MTQNKMPVIFAGHGSPMNAIDENPARSKWRELGQELEKPDIIIALSAHWMSRGKTYVRKSSTNPQINDMYGFPRQLYEIRYEPAGSPAFADNVLNRLGDCAEVNNDWGIDHGVWSVLSNLFPDADIPVVMVSTDLDMSPEGFYEMGCKLAPLRKEGALLFASGNVVHNLRLVDSQNPAGYPWAENFDETIKRAVLSGDFETVLHYGTIEGSRNAVPTPEHFSPLLAALGASDPGDRVTVWNDYRELGSLSMTSYTFHSNMKEVHTL